MRACKPDHIPPLLVHLEEIRLQREILVKTAPEVVVLESQNGSVTHCVNYDGKMFTSAGYFLELDSVTKIPGLVEHVVYGDGREHPVGDSAVSDLVFVLHIVLVGGLVTLDGDVERLLDLVLVTVERALGKGLPVIIERRAIPGPLNLLEGDSTGPLNEIRQPFVSFEDFCHSMYCYWLLLQR